MSSSISAATGFGAALIGLLAAHRLLVVPPLQAQQIAALYKQRWQIELFFKWIKQHLKLKHYFGCSENAVRLQIYSALLAFLLLHAYRRHSCATGSIYEFATQLAYSLFERPAAMLKAAERRRNQAKLRIAMGSLQL
ncbi:transposase IS4 family protein [Stutzerimonas stutzeri DSM 10701]|nr:transposase IS4 family protein [Stutzerimonas stutzeri DSM 10701]